MISSKPIAVHKPEPARASRVVTFYLMAYNLVSFMAWGGFLYMLVRALVETGGDLWLVFGQTHRQLAVVQTAAVFEIVHAMLGWVPAYVVPTALQVGSRLFITWFACERAQVGVHFAFPVMAFAWALSDAVRYLYYIASLSGMRWRWLVWCRYSFFFVLYPMGTACEIILINLARILPKYSQHQYPLWAVLVAYPFGLAFMYSHMIKQRIRCLCAGGMEKRHKSA